MQSTRKATIRFNNTAACIVAAGVSPFALCGVTGFFANHTSRPLMVFYWLITITGLLTAKHIKELGRRCMLTISKEFIIYKEPFTSKLIKFADVLSIQAAADKHLIIDTLSTTLVVPCSIFTSNHELAKARALLERFAPPSCRIDLRSIALGTN